MGSSTLHIKTEVECRVFLFDEEKGIATPGSYFNLEVRKGDQDLLFVSTEDETICCQILYNVEENDCDYRIVIGKTQFIKYSQDFLEQMRLAEQGDADAQYKLGKCYYYGRTVAKDYEKAVEWYTKSAKQGNVRAQSNLGFCYNKGWGVEKDCEKAVEWYTKAAEQGDANAQNNLGICYKNGEGVEQNYQKAVEWYTKSAEQGNARAQYNLGICYEYGRSVAKDYEKAVEWYTKAAKQGDANAQYNLGVCYIEGCGVEKDYEKGVECFFKAAKQGNARAQSNLGFCYNKGWGVEKDDEKAVEWYTKAAEQGDAIAQYNLGVCYYKGLGVEREYKKAVEWYVKAVEQGDASAQNNLGVCYDKGQGVEQDYLKAVEWYTKAAEQGNAIAQKKLGVCYEKGNGVEQDHTKAIKWYRKAAEQGDKDAENALKRIESNLENGRNQTNNTKPPYYLFFDTETTGVPEDYKAPASDTKNWPRLVQLGWILTDNNGNILHQGNEIVSPDGFTIPANASYVHGITTDKAMRVGKPLRDVIDIFLSDVKQSQCLVGHNISFDQHVVGAELYRLGLQDIVSHKQCICTMQSTIDYCKIPGYNGYKYPKLQELFYKLFGSNFEDAHDAMADITATKKCFFELKRLGVINSNSLQNFDFENAEIVCSVALKDFERGTFKIRKDINSRQYYLIIEPSFSGLEGSLIAYASDGSGRKPNYYKDSLIIYQNDDYFAAAFDKNSSEDEEEDEEEDYEDYMWFNKI